MKKGILIPSPSSGVARIDNFYLNEEVKCEYKADASD
jgi:hypothetical protein